MSSKTPRFSAAFLLVINLLFFSLVNASVSAASCPIDALKLGACANLLNLIDVVIGSPPTLPCCSLIQGLVDIEAAACLCTAIRANVLGINLNVSVSLSLILNVCAKNPPSGFFCP